MRAPHAFLAMVVLLLVFAVVTYLFSGSITITFLRTVLASICLQACYFTVVVYLALLPVRERWEEPRPDRASEDAPSAHVSPRKNADL